MGTLHEMHNAPREMANAGAFPVCAPGARVRIGYPEADIPARVLGVEVQARGICYRVEWWDGRTRHEEWVAEDSITVNEGQPSISLIWTPPF